jgi:hypothetical protein
MSGTLPIRPNATVTLSPTTTSVNATIFAGDEQIEIQNAGGVTVFCRWGIGAQTAVVTDYPVLAGQSKTVTIGSGNNNFAAICQAGTSTVYVTTGEGA